MLAIGRRTSSPLRKAIRLYASSTTTRSGDAAEEEVEENESDESSSKEDPTAKGSPARVVAVTIGVGVVAVSVATDRR